MDKQVNRNIISQANFIKGLGVFLIVGVHVVSLWNLESVMKDSGVGFFLGILLFIFRNSLMPIFFIIFGMSLKTTGSIKKEICKKAQVLLKPYLVVAIFTTILNFFAHFLCFRNIQAALKESVKVLVGFLLGEAHTVNIASHTIYSNGASWFFIALLVGICIYRLLFKYAERYMVLASGGVSMLAIIIGTYYPDVPFCILQGMLVVPFLYLGYCIKKNKWLDKKINLPIWFLIGVLSLIEIIFGNLNFASCIWNMGILEIPLSAVLGFAMLRFLMKSVDFFGNNIIIKILKKWGWYSLWIIYIHTVEMIALPWYLLAQRMQNHISLGIFFMWTLKGIIIYCSIKCIKLYQKYKRAKK